MDSRKKACCRPEKKRKPKAGLQSQPSASHEESKKELFLTRQKPLSCERYQRRGSKQRYQRGITFGKTRRIRTSFCPVKPFAFRIFRLDVEMPTWCASYFQSAKTVFHRSKV